jgi:hypothetical protein
MSDAAKSDIVPRLLSEQLAAQYLGRSRTRFREQVAKRVLPQPSDANGNRKLWDRFALDRYIDARSGFDEQSSSWDDL